MRDKKKTKLKWTKNKSNRESGERYIYSKERAVDAERGGDLRKDLHHIDNVTNYVRLNQKQETNK